MQLYKKVEGWMYKSHSRIVLSLLFIMASFFVAEAKETGLIQILPINNAPEPQAVTVHLIFPLDGVFLDQNPVKVQVRVEGFALGIKSAVDRAKVLPNTPIGQYLNVVVDNKYSFAFTGPSIASLEPEGNYFERMYVFDLPFTLEPGRHSLCIFPVRSYGESLKGKGCLEGSFFFLKREDRFFGVDFSKPYIIFNAPIDTINVKEKDPLLLDFYVGNCTLSPDGYKIKLTIDNSIVRYLVKWCPYYIYGLKSGEHKIRLQLVDSKQKLITTEQGIVERSIKIF